MLLSAGEGVQDGFEISVREVEAGAQREGGLGGIRKHPDIRRTPGH